MRGFQRLAVVFASTSAVALPNIDRRQTTPIAITGAKEGSVQPRLEIHELQQNEDQFNIYLLALQSFQAMDVTDPMSWYQIAGIHGVPYVDYNGVHKCSSCNGVGYCTHHSTLFPQWHRAYLGLFEQSLQENALKVAGQFSGVDKTRYTAAASVLRMPYWDYGLHPPEGENPFPQLFTNPTVSVNTPTGKQTIPNPLSSYSFGSADHSCECTLIFQFGLRNTGRQVMKTDFTPDSDVTIRNPTLNTTFRQSLRPEIWAILTSNQGYNAFSTESLVSRFDNWKPHSLEMLHDQIHTRVGGDMGYIPTAGFDPVFMIHHATIDRLFALWQAVYPNDWVVPWKEVGTTYTHPAGSMLDGQSDLTPFHSSSSGSFWNSDALRTTEVLNYNYADLTSGKSVASVINTLYRDNETPFSKRTTEDSTTEVQYVASIQADTMSTKGSFTVYLFDDQLDEEDASSWDESTSLLGTHGFFTDPERRGNGKSLVEAAVTITPALQRAVKDRKLSGLDKASVTSYLRKNLTWRVLMLNGAIVEPNDIPGLEVAILTSEVEIPISNDEMPTWSKYEVLPEITKDKICGYRAL